MTICIPLILLGILQALLEVQGTACDLSGHVCGTNGKTYKNICQLNRAKIEDPDLHALYRGRCTKRYLSYNTPSDYFETEEYLRTKPTRKNLSCPLIPEPVCGSDKQTYMNECFLNASAAEDPTLRLDYPGLCNGYATTMQFTPKQKKTHRKKQKRHRKRPECRSRLNIQNDAGNLNSIDSNKPFDGSVNLNNDAKNINNISGDGCVDIDVKNDVKNLNNINIG